MIERPGKKVDELSNPPSFTSKKYYSILKNSLDTSNKKHSIIPPLIDPVDNTLKITAKEQADLLAKQYSAASTIEKSFDDISN